MSIIELGKFYSEATRRKLSLSLLGNTNCKGRVPWNKGGTSWSKGKYLSKEHRQKIGLANKGQVRSIEQRLKMSGLNAPNWKGGTTPINKRLRRSKDFKDWREAVFKRDDWTCQECNQRGGELHPDHIKPFALFPELRFELSNGRTLCKACHMKTDTWGVRTNKNKPCQISL